MGKYFASSACRSGQPSVPMGQRPEENHVSRTSGSRTETFDRVLVTHVFQARERLASAAVALRSGKMLQRHSICVTRRCSELCNGLVEGGCAEDRSIQIGLSQIASVRVSTSAHTKPESGAPTTAGARCTMVRCCRASCSTPSRRSRA